MDAAAASSAALDAMSALPCATHEMEKTVNFINGAGDYAMALSRAVYVQHAGRGGSAKRGHHRDHYFHPVLGKTMEIYGALSEGAVKMDDYGECSDAATRTPWAMSCA